MNNLLSYCGLVDARISASEKDLPVKCTQEDLGSLVCLNLKRNKVPKQIELKILTYSMY